MKTIFILALSMFFNIQYINAQDKNKQHGSVTKAELKKAEVTTVPVPDSSLLFAEQMPVYPGGDEALNNFIQRNIRYPKKAIEKKLGGTVWVQFIIDNTGKIVDPKIIKSVSPELDKEALRIIGLMPNWSPGKNNGLNTNVFVKLPIKFILPEDKINSIKK